MSNSRNLSKLSVDSNGDIAEASLDNVPPSDDASALTTGTLDIARIADASVTATKLASGAAASNLGNYVTTVNSSTGAVTVQPTLVSGTNIKTVNSTSLLGSGDVAVQPTLVSGTNIKTVNGTSLLGSGNITAGASTDFGAVGTYSWFRIVSWNQYTDYANSTFSGSGLYYGGFVWNTDGNDSILWRTPSVQPSGTWRMMTRTYSNSGSYIPIGLFVRIS